MRVKVKTKTRIPEMKNQARKLNGKVLSVGIFDGDMAEIAAVHEFGAVITPKNKQWLCIPLKRRYRGVNPRSLDLFFLRTDNNTAWLCKNVGRDRIEFCYMLAKKVVIPERSFLRAGWDNCERDFFKFAEKQIEKWVKQGNNPEIMLDALGLELQGYIQEYAIDLSSPPNSNITKTVKGSSNPLVDTGQMIGSIEYKVE